MLDARKKIIIGGGITLLLLVGFLILVLLLLPDNVEKDNGTSESPVTDTVAPVITAPAPLPNDQVERVSPPEEVDERVVAKQAARIFVERFGTYSNQNKNAHIELVLPGTTEVMAGWLNSQAIDQGGAFFGMTTEVLASSLVSLSDTEAVVSIQVRIVREENDTVSTEIKNGRVELVNAEDDRWLVDGLYYE